MPASVPRGRSMWLGQPHPQYLVSDEVSLGGVIVKDDSVERRVMRFNPGWTEIDKDMKLIVFDNFKNVQRKYVQLWKDPS